MLMLASFNQVKFYLSQGGQFPLVKRRPPGFRHNEKTTKSTWPKLDAADDWFI